MMAKRAIYSGIGLDMTSDRIRLLQLKWQGESLSIHAASQASFSKAEITDGQDEKELPDFCTVLRRLLSSGKFKGKQVMVALPDHLVTTIPIKFTLKEGEGIDQAILREANNYLPFPQDQGGTVSSYFVIDYLDIPGKAQDPHIRNVDLASSDQRSQQTREKRQDAASTIKAQPMSALLIAARTEDVLRYLNLLKNAGLEAAVIEPRYCSLFRTIQWAQQGEPLKDQFIFSMEENDTLLMVIVAEQILIVRGLAWGINAIKEKLEKALGLSGTVADLVLQNYGVDDLWRSSQRLEKGTDKKGMSSRISHNPDRERSGVFLSDGNLCQVIYEVLSPVLEDFCQEIQKVLSYCVSMVQQRVIDRALLLGEGARIKSLDHFIQQRTGIRITAWPPTTINGPSPLGGAGEERGTGRRGEGEMGWIEGRKSYRLSLKDNNALKHAASLLEAGVSSLKIEGRLKNFYYVYQTVTAWREQLERIYAGAPPNPDDSRLHKVFNRGFSAGYLENGISGQMFADSPLDNSLSLVGEVKNYLADQHLLQLTTVADLAIGVKINIYTPDNYFICTAIVEEKKAANAFRIRLEHLVRDKILKGHMVFTLRDTDEIVRIKTRLRNMEINRPLVQVRVDGEEGQRLRAIFCSEHKAIAVESVIPLQKAIKNPLTQGTFLEIFGKLGDTSFTLKGVDCSDLKGDLFLPVSELNKLRRSAVSQLESEEDAEDRVGPAMQIPPLQRARAKPRKSSMAILVSDLEEASFFSSITKTVLLEINSAEEFQQAAPCLSICPNIIPFFPAILFEKECSRLAHVLDKAICSRIVADNSGLGLTAVQKGIGWVAGPAFNCTNPYAVRALQEEGGAEGVFLSLELNARQIRDACAASGAEIWLVVMGPLLLMTTRQCLLRGSSHCRKKACDEQCLPSCRQYAVWYDELDMPFHVCKRTGTYTQVFNNAVLFIPEAVHLLRGMISHFVLDMRSFPFYRPVLADKKKIMDYFTMTLAGESGQDQDKKDQDKKAMKEILSETTTGHFKRGI